MGGGNTPLLFYSRRVGLHAGTEVPIIAGGRVTGRVGKYSLGLINIQTDDEPLSGALTTNFSVARIKRDVLRRSNIGAIVTNRSTRADAPGWTQTYGVDATFAFYDNVAFTTYRGKTQTAGRRGQDTSYKGEFRYTGDRYGVRAEHLFVDAQFAPGVGFVRRDDFRKSFGSFRFSPRPRAIEAVRKFTWEASYTDTYDFLKDPFTIAPGITIPVGGYDFWNARTVVGFGQQRRIAGSLFAEYGAFYGGTKTALGFGGGGPFSGRIELTPQFSFQPALSFNWIDLPQGSFTTRLMTARTTYTVTLLMFVSALVQYNSSND